MSHSSSLLLAGIDEAGRGPLVGNVVAGAVILDPNNPIEGLMDSKKLSEKKRAALYDEIMEKALSVGVGEASVAEIDELNILWASMLAMRRAFEALPVQPDRVQVDGNRTPDITVPCEAIVKGDSLVAEISAGSIIAKVTRDRQMEALDKRHPEYGFAKHKGYPTKIHLDCLRRLGPLAEHRRSFGPVARLLVQAEVC